MNIWNKLKLCGKDNEIRIFLALFFFLFLPSILAFSLFWYNVKVPVTYKKIDDGKVLFTVHREEILRPTFKNTIRKVFQAPFDLDYYKICFLNKSSVVSMANKITPLSAKDITFQDINGNVLDIKPIDIKENGYTCHRDEFRAVSACLEHCGWCF